MRVRSGNNGLLGSGWTGMNMSWGSLPRILALIISDRIKRGLAMEALRRALELRKPLP